MAEGLYLVAFWNRKGGFVALTSELLPLTEVSEMYRTNNYTAIYNRVK